ncbi:MAG: hypothetical protein ACXV74_00410 [Methylobacter sp.]
MKKIFIAAMLYINQPVSNNLLNIKEKLLRVDRQVLRVLDNKKQKSPTKAPYFAPCLVFQYLQALIILEPCTTA